MSSSSLWEIRPALVAVVLSITRLKARENRDAKPPPMDELDLPLLLYAPKPNLLWPKEGPPPTPWVDCLPNRFLPIGAVDELAPNIRVP